MLACFHKPSASFQNIPKCFHWYFYVRLAQHGNICYSIRLSTLQVHHFKTLENASASICLFTRLAKQVPLGKMLIWLSIVKFEDYFLKFVFRREHQFQRSSPKQMLFHISLILLEDPMHSSCTTCRLMIPI